MREEVRKIRADDDIKKRLPAPQKTGDPFRSPMLPILSLCAVPVRACGEAVLSPVAIGVDRRNRHVRVGSARRPASTPPRTAVRRVCAAVHPEPGPCDRNMPHGSAYCTTRLARSHRPQVDAAKERFYFPRRPMPHKYYLHTRGLPFRVWFDDDGLPDSK